MVTQVTNENAVQRLNEARYNNVHLKQVHFTYITL